MNKKVLLAKISNKIKENLTALLFMFPSIFGASYCYAVAVGESYGGGTVFCVSQTPPDGQCTRYRCESVGSGDCGLIMANEDQANFDSSNHGVPWSSEEIAVPGARSPYDGASNTAAIIAAFPGDNSGNNAAWLCHNYIENNRIMDFLTRVDFLTNEPGDGLPKELNELIVGYEALDDWYLPSKDELNKMYVYALANNLIGVGCAGSRVGGVQCLVGPDSGNGNLGLVDPRNNHVTYWSSYDDPRDNLRAWGQSFKSSDRGGLHKSVNYLGVRAVRAFNNSSIQQINNLHLNLNQSEITQGIAENTLQFRGDNYGPCSAAGVEEKVSSPYN